MFEIAPNRKVLITGGASGVGLAAAEGLVPLGARRALADVDERGLRTAADRLAKGTVAVSMDVSSAKSVRAGVAASAHALGGLDTLVNSAGVWSMRPFLEVTEE